MTAKQFRHLIVGFTVGAVGLSALASVTVPFTFTAGTPIKASEVNANFTALKTAVDGLSSGTLPFGSTITGSGDAALTLENTTTAGGKYALSATTNSGVSEGAAVRGLALKGTGIIGDSTEGNGVIGRTGLGSGVSGQSRTGFGVYGENLLKGDGVAGIAVEGAGVLGRTTSALGVGVRAINEIKGSTGLELKGGIKVVGDDKPAFVLTVSAANLDPNNKIVFIDSPFTNSKPDAMVFAHRRLRKVGTITGALNTGYTGGRWYLSNGDFSDFQSGETFSVLVVNQ
jgi:hypothetical protein